MKLTTPTPLAAPAVLTPQPLPPAQTPYAEFADPALVRFEYDLPKIQVDVDRTLFGSPRVTLHDRVMTAEASFTISPTRGADGRSSIENAIRPVGSFDDALSAAAELVRSRNVNAAIVEMAGPARYGVALLRRTEEIWIADRAMDDARVRSTKMDLATFMKFTSLNQGRLHGRDGKPVTFTAEDYARGTVPPQYVAVRNTSHVNAVSRSSTHVAAVVTSIGTFDLRAGDLRTVPTDFTRNERGSFSAFGIRD